MKRVDAIIVICMVGLILTGIGTHNFLRTKHPETIVVRVDTFYLTNDKPVIVEQKLPVPNTRYDSLVLELNKNIYAFAKQRDSLKTKLFLAQYKIEKVKYYLSIVDRKPSQIKYLKGWVRRAVE